MAGSCKTEGLNASATGQNQLSGIGVVYDAAGNVTNDGGGNTPTYDAENRISTDDGYTYYYDADGVRMEKTNGSAGTMYWPGPGGETLTETSLAGTINEEYVYLNGERIARIDRPSGTVNYYFSNHLGSASVITSATGVIQEQMDFYPFGGVAYSSGSDPNHYKFTGKERDTESGLDNFGARYFTSGLGRFMTPDWAVRPTAVPYALFGDPQSLNLYTYVRNDPVTRADADGHECPEAQRCNKKGADTQSSAEEAGLYNGTAEGKNQDAQNTKAQNIAEQFRSAGTISEHVGGDFDLGVRITYDKNVPEMEPATKEYVEKVTLSAVGVDSVNISATTNGEHAPNSNHYNGTAVDINKVNGDRVINAGNDTSVSGHVSSIQNAANTPKNGVAHENYGPAGLWKDGRAIRNPTLQAQHENHIHITIPRDDE